MLWQFWWKCSRNGSLTNASIEHAYVWKWMAEWFSGSSWSHCLLAYSFIALILPWITNLTGFFRQLPVVLLISLVRSLTLKNVQITFLFAISLSRCPIIARFNFLSFLAKILPWRERFVCPFLLGSAAIPRNSNILRTPTFSLTFPLPEILCRRAESYNCVASPPIHAVDFNRLSLSPRRPVPIFTDTIRRFAACESTFFALWSIWHLLRLFLAYTETFQGLPFQL